jgi:hypothetical protein
MLQQGAYPVKLVQIIKIHIFTMLWKRLWQDTYPG